MIDPSGIHPLIDLAIVLARRERGVVSGDGL
jgi:hypothetical protein